MVPWNGVVDSTTTPVTTVDIEQTLKDIETSAISVKDQVDKILNGNPKATPPTTQLPAGEAPSKTNTDKVKIAYYNINLALNEIQTFAKGPTTNPAAI